MQVLSGLLPLAVCCVVIAATPIRQEGTSGTALDDGIKAIDFYLKGNTDLKCGWERGTFMLGLIELYKASKSQHLLDYAMNWAESYKWLLCDSPDANARSVTIGRDVPPGTHDADNQLCAATYIELYRLTGQSNQTVVPVVLPSPKRTVLAASIYHSVHTNHLVYHMEQTDDRRDDGGIRQRDQ
eukprot:m.561056 g.561056  ORF g.561056 m.561056 type:complete len:184 (+) comp22212_c2_seq44:75-626(+)